MLHGAQCVTVCHETLPTELENRISMCLCHDQEVSSLTYWLEWESGARPGQESRGQGLSYARGQTRSQVSGARQDQVTMAS